MAQIPSPHVSSKKQQLDVASKDPNQRAQALEIINEEAVNQLIEVLEDLLSNDSHKSKLNSCDSPKRIEALQEENQIMKDIIKYIKKK